MQNKKLNAKTKLAHNALFDHFIHKNLRVQRPSLAQQKLSPQSEKIEANNGGNSWQQFAFYGLLLIITPSLMFP